MKKYLIILLSLLCLCLDTELYAQRRNPAKNADLAFGRKQYIEAVDLYKKAYKRSRRNKSERARISYQMGECYRLIGLTKRAEPYYRRVLKTDFPNTHTRKPSNAMRPISSAFPTIPEGLLAWRRHNSSRNGSRTHRGMRSRS